jgi:DNA-binding transcriptional ArsR family regulator
MAVAPYWTRVRSRFTLEPNARTRVLATGGVSALLSTLHPALSWDPPVLTLRGLSVNRDLRLEGRGIRILPSFFCWRHPIFLKDPALPPVLVYPMLHGTGVDVHLGTPGSRASKPLEPLLGRTRAKVLEAVAQGLSTTELAHVTGISAATASHHVGVLREAGLVVSLREGSAVLHALTPLGRSLLTGD